MAASDVIATILGHVFTTLVVVLRLGILTLEYGLNAYPKLTTYALTLVALYIAYKIIGKIFRMWLNFIISLVKVTLFLWLIFFLALVYLRGSKLFTLDIEFAKNFLFGEYCTIFENDTSVADYIDSFIRWGYSVVSGGIWNALSNGSYSIFFKDPMNGGDGDQENLGFGFEFDRRAFEYAKDFAKQNINKESVQDFVAENMDNIEHMLRDLGIDVNQVLNNFMQNNR